MADTELTQAAPSLHEGWVTVPAKAPESMALPLTGYTLEGLKLERDIEVIRERMQYRWTALLAAAQAAPAPTAEPGSDELPPMPKPQALRRQQRQDGGYDMVPAYTAQEMQAYAQAALAAAQPLRPPCDCLTHCGDGPAMQAGDAQPCHTSRRAHEIADQAMYELLLCECVHIDEEGLTLGLVDESAREVNALAQASQAIRDAFAWLQPREYVRISRDQDGEYIDVLRRPGEE